MIWVPELTKSGENLSFLKANFGVLFLCETLPRSDRSCMVFEIKNDKDEPQKTNREVHDNVLGFSLPSERVQHTHPKKIPANKHSVKGCFKKGSLKKLENKTLAVGRV